MLQRNLLMNSCEDHSYTAMNIDRTCEVPRFPPSSRSYACMQHPPLEWNWHEEERVCSSSPFASGRASNPQKEGPALWSFLISAWHSCWCRCRHIRSLTNQRDWSLISQELWPWWQSMGNKWLDMSMLVWGEEIENPSSGYYYHL